MENHKKLFKTILEATKDISTTEDYNFRQSIHIFLTAIGSKSISIIYEDKDLTKKLKSTSELMEKLQEIPNIILDYGPYYSSKVYKFIVINKEIYPKIKTKLEKFKRDEEFSRDILLGKLLDYPYPLDLKKFHYEKGDRYYTIQYLIKRKDDEELLPLFWNFCYINKSLKKASDKLLKLNESLKVLDIQIEMKIKVKI